MGYRLRKLAEYVRGWMGYFRITKYYRPIPRLDQWIRRRIRCCFVKRWRRPKTRYRNLVMLGVDRIKAALIAASSIRVLPVEQNVCGAAGVERQLSCKPWACFIKRLVDQVSPSSVNRRMRTPHVRWCVGWRLETSGYPISLPNRCSAKVPYPHCVTCQVFFWQDGWFYL